MLWISCKANSSFLIALRDVYEKERSAQKAHPRNQNGNIINIKSREKFSFIQKYATDVKMEAGLRAKQV